MLIQKLGNMGLLSIVFLIIFLPVIIAVLLSGFRKYREWERGIVFRLGRFNRIVGPGIAYIIPFIETEYMRVDTRVQKLEVAIDKVYTKDNAELKVTAVIYFRIKDPKKIINLDLGDLGANKEDAVKNFIKELFISEVRDTIGALFLDEVFSNIDKLNDHLQERLRYFVWKWGIIVESVQLTEVIPSKKIAAALQEVKIAQQRLLAQRYLAEARKIVLKAIGEAAKNLDDRAIVYLYLQALKELGAAPSSKLVLPAEFFDIFKSTGNKSEIEKSLKGISVSQAIQAIKKVIEEESKKK